MHTRMIVACLFISAASAAAQTSAQRPLLGGAGAVVMDVAPTASPTTLVQLVRASIVIVDGTVSSLLPAINTSQNADALRLETHSIIAVNAVLSGSVLNNSANILMAQIGGQTGSRSLSVAGDPMVLQGERYILFLVPDVRRELPNTSGMPRYAVTGVWSGKAKIVNGGVVFADSASAELRAYNGQSVDSFLQTLKAAINHPFTGAQLPINLAPAH